MNISEDNDLDEIMHLIHMILESDELSDKALYVSFMIKELTYQADNNSPEHCDEVRHSIYQYLRMPHKIGEHYDAIV